MAQQINLFHAGLRRPRELLSLANVALAAGAFAVVFVGIGGVFRWLAQESRLEAQAADRQLAAETAKLAALAALPGAEAARQALAATQKQVAERREVVALLQTGVGAGGSGVGFSEYLRGLARQSVGGLWLRGFSVQMGGQGMEIRGHMTDSAALTGYIQRLNSEASFRGVQFSSLSVLQPAASAAPGVAVVDNYRPGVNSFVLTASAEPARDAGGGK